MKFVGKVEDKKTHCRYDTTEFEAKNEADAIKILKKSCNKQKLFKPYFVQEVNSNVMHFA